MPKLSQGAFDRTEAVVKTVEGQFYDSAPERGTTVHDGRDGCIVTVKNGAGYAIPQFGILGIDAPRFTPATALPRFKAPIALSGASPTVANHLGKWCVLLRKTEDGGSCQAVAAGVVQTRVYVNGVSDTHCDVIAKKTVSSEDCYLGTGSSGAQILWRENAGSGVGTICWAIVRMGGVVGSGVDGSAPQFYNSCSLTVPKYGVAIVIGKNSTELGYAIPECFPYSHDPYTEEYLISDVETPAHDHSASPPTTGVGTYQNDGEMVLVLYDTGTPAVRELWVPKDGQFTLTKGLGGEPWGVRVAGIYDSDAKILIGRVVKHSTAHLWGKIQTTVTNQSGATHLTVSVQKCDIDGNNPTGGSFNVRTPLSPRAMTDLAMGDVVGYTTDDAGEKWIATDCWATGSGGVDDGKDWVGLDDESILIHYTPESGQFVEADPDVGWPFTVPACGLAYFDDGGHFIGYKNQDELYSTGTVTTSGANKRTVTLSGGTFPVHSPIVGEANLFQLRIPNMGGTSYVIASRDSPTVLTLDENGPDITNSTYVYRYTGWTSPWANTTPPP